MLATVAVNTPITLDGGGANPVTVTFVALNGNGVSTTDENDLSLVSVVRFGQFDAEFGGDLSGAGTGVADPDPSAPCAYTVSPTSQSLTTSAATFAVSVTTTAGCTWAASTSTAWLSVPAGSLTGTGSINVSALVNTSTARNGTAMVGYDSPW